MKAAGKVTSLDVARQAGVSQSAVSLVLGGKSSGRVGRTATKAILRAARKLSYAPNVAARTLRLGRSRLLVLAVPDVENPYFAGALRGAEREARSRGYAVTLATVQNERDWQQVILDAVSSGAVDGFLLFTMHPPSARERTALRNKAVLVDESHAAFPSLGLDIETGVRSAILHLRQLGHAKIGHLAASIEAETFVLRRRIYLEALQEAKLIVSSSYQEEAPFSISAATAAARRMLTRRDRPSAIFCDSDVLAVGVYKAAKALGLEIPTDLSVVGIDDSIVARILDPELTTVAIPAQTVGQQSLRLLLQLLEGSDVPRRTTVPLTLLVRGSTAPPDPTRSL